MIRVGVAGAAGRVGAAVCDGRRGRRRHGARRARRPALGRRAGRHPRRLRRGRRLHPPDTALDNALACVRAGVHAVIGTTGFDPAPLRGRRAARNVFVAPELRDRRGAHDALRRRGVAVHGQGRDHRAAPRRQARRAQRHRRAHGRADGRRRADPLRAPAGPGRPPGGHPRRRRPDADDPPRLDRPHVVHARRAAGRPPRRRTCPSRRSSGSSTCCDPRGDRGRRPGDRRAPGARLALGLRRLHRARRHAGRGRARARVARAHRRAAASACSTRTARSSATRPSRTTSSRASTSTRRRRAPASARGCSPTPPSASARPGTRARLAVRLRRRTRHGLRVLRAPRLGARSAGWWARRTGAAPRLPLRARRSRASSSPSPTTPSSASASASAGARRARRAAGDRRARRRAPWEAGRVDDEPPPGATGARGSVYVRDLVDRSLVFVCRHDRGAGEVVVVTLWEAEGGAAPPRVAGGGPTAVSRRSG